MMSPRIFGSPGHCLFIIVAAAFEYSLSSENIYRLLVLPKGIHCVPPDPICFAAEKQANITNWDSCKTYRSQEKVFPVLCFSCG